jgi:NADP-dependent 3-hydroxy acid dehydrogenase YdfG
VVITGVTSGIGEELATTLLTLGATVYGLSRSEAKMEAFATKNKELKGTFKPVRLWCFSVFSF